MADQYRLRMVKAGDDIGDVTVYLERTGGTECDEYSVTWKNRHPVLGRDRIRCDLQPLWEWPGEGCPPRQICIDPVAPATNVPEVQVIWFALHEAGNWDGTYSIGFCVDRGLACTTTGSEVLISGTAQAALEAAILSHLNTLYGASVVEEVIVQWADDVNGWRHYGIAIRWVAGVPYDPVLAWIVYDEFEDGATANCSGETFAIPQNPMIVSPPWGVSGGQCDVSLSRPGFLLPVCPAEGSEAYVYVSFVHLSWPFQQTIYIPNMTVNVGACTAGGSVSFNSGTCTITASDMSTDTSNNRTVQYAGTIAFTESAGQVSLVATLRITSGSDYVQGRYTVTLPAGADFSTSDIVLLYFDSINAHTAFSASGNTAEWLSGAEITVPPYIYVYLDNVVDADIIPLPPIQPVTERLQVGGGPLKFNEFQFTNASDDDHTLTFSGGTTGTISKDDDEAAIAALLTPELGGGSCEIHKTPTSGASLDGGVIDGIEPALPDQVCLYIVEFTGTLAETNVAEMTISTGNVETIADGGTIVFS